MPQADKKFDLNMEEILEDWGKSDAIREIISNALDEQALTGTDSIDIYEDDEGRWHIRDYGRGLEYKHLTQKEADEKLENPDRVIGKFGVGLKDALATLYRRGVDVTIHSTHNTFKIKRAPKHGFRDIKTLHAWVEEPERDIQGTDVIMKGVEEEDIKEAKGNFLHFSDLELLEGTEIGEVYDSPEDGVANIYVTGLKVAREDNFLFSYNITKTTKKVRRALNRERSNVGRTAYSSRVKKILQKCGSAEVAKPLVEDLERFERGETHDELSWKAVRLHACKLLNAKDEVVFVTPREREEDRYVLNHARGDGYRLVTVPENIQRELSGQRDIEGNKIRNVKEYEREYNESFSYDWVDPGNLTESESGVWKMRGKILDLLPNSPQVREIKISETMRLNIDSPHQEVNGQWDPARKRIIIKRDQLERKKKFAKTFLHELAHAQSNGADDLSLEFEDALGSLLGELACSALEKSS